MAVASDHGGFPLKKIIVDYVSELGHVVSDLGTCSDEPVDYPDYAGKLCEEVLSGRAARGILICGSGVGATVAANKFPGIRAGLCHDSFSARQSMEDDDTNILCLGARVVGPELAKDLVRIWLQASFSGAERHRRRVAKIGLIEGEILKIKKVRS